MPSILFGDHARKVECRHGLPRFTYCHECDCIHLSHPNAYCHVCDKEPTMTSPEEKEHAEMEPLAHTMTCDCEACAMEPKTRYAVTVGECVRYRDTEEDARELAYALQRPGKTVSITRALDTRYRDWKTALAGAALLAALLLPGHVDAQQLHTGTSVIIGGSDCQVNHAFEDGSAVAHCRDHTTWAYDADGNALYGIAPGTWVKQRHTQKGAYGR